MIEQILNLFIEVYLESGRNYLTGEEIIEKFSLADKQYLDDHNNHKSGFVNTKKIDDFFIEFCYSNRILDINPEYEIASTIWINNHYGLKPECQREIKLKYILGK